MQVYLKTTYERIASSGQVPYPGRLHYTADGYVFHFPLALHTQSFSSKRMRVPSALPPRHWQGAVETPNCLWLHPVPPPGPAPSVLAAASPPHATQIVQLLTAASLAGCHLSRHQTHPVATPVASITTSVISYLGRKKKEFIRVMPAFLFGMTVAPTSFFSLYFY